MVEEYEGLEGWRKRFGLVSRAQNKVITMGRGRKRDIFIAECVWGPLKE